MAQILTVALSCQLRSTISEQPARICSFRNTEVSVHRHHQASYTKKRSLRVWLLLAFRPLWLLEAGRVCLRSSGNSVSEPNLLPRPASAFHSLRKADNQAIEQISERTSGVTTNGFWFLSPLAMQRRYMALGMRWLSHSCAISLQR